MSWMCPLCFHENRERGILDGWKCELCALRKDAKSVNHTSLCVVHSTLKQNFNKIRKEGFKITKNPLAGRSLGDVVYGYSYTGGDFHGSVSHAVNGCWTSNPKDDRFVIFQVALELPFNKVFVFDQPEWERIMDVEGRSSYAALYKMYGKKLADAARERLVFWHRQRKGSSNISSEQAEAVKPDHIAEGARALGADAVYMLGTGIITFYEPSQLGVADVWLEGEAPASGNSPEAAQLLEWGHIRAQVKYTAFRWQVK